MQLGWIMLTYSSLEAEIGAEECQRNGDAEPQAQQSQQSRERNGS